MSMQIRFPVSHIAILAVAILSMAACQGPEGVPEPSPGQASQGAAASARPAAVMPAALARAVGLAQQREAGAEYFLRGQGSGLVASNPARGLKARFEGGAMTATADDESWSVGLELLRWGRAGAVRDAGAPAVQTLRNRLSMGRSGGMEEWYLNGPLGLEHGFTLQARPGKAAAGPLFLELAVRGPLSPRAAEDGRSVTFHDLDGQARAIYRDLVVEDAAGHEVAASLAVSPAGGIQITVRDQGAAFPLVIDPMLMGVMQKVTAKDGSKGDNFGHEVAIEGDTALVSSIYDDDRGVDSGSVYFYTRVGSRWVQQQKLTAKDGAAGDRFGKDVALSGNVAVVGAYLDDDKGAETGAAYIFVRSGNTWTQQQKILGNDVAAGDRFGVSVAVSGETVLVGSYYDDDKGSNSGSAYIFTRSGSTWSQQAKLVPGAGAAGDLIGVDVALRGDTALVSCHRDDDKGVDSGSAYIFTRSGTSWSERKKLTASDGAKGDHFGLSVALAAGTALIGARYEDTKGSDSGSAYVFTGSGASWSQQQKLTATNGAGGDSFGYSVWLDNNRAVVGALLVGSYNFGSAYMFQRSGTQWTQRRYITAVDRTNYDRFGSAVAISGSTVLAAAYLDDDRGTDSGSAYFFKVCDADDPKKLKASDGVKNDWFGHSVAASGTTIVAGSPYDDDMGSNSGSAYVFTRSGANWGQQTKLVPSSGGSASDYFGWSVSVSGDTAAVGAHNDDPSGSNSGSAYVFRRIGTNWSQQQRIVAPGGAANDWFGHSLAVSGDTLLVGTPYDDDRGSGSGSAFIFARSGTKWSMQRKLTASDGHGSDYFGWSVALSGNTAVIGAYLDDDRGGNSGSAYVYTRTGTSWNIQQKLTASDGAGSDYFGYSVSVSGERAGVGAFANDDRGSSSGSAYVFARSGSQWTQEVKLTAQDGEQSDSFGHTVAISGDRLLVGAPYDDEKAGNSGTAYLYQRVGGQWVHQQKHVASDGATSDYYGWSVAISGEIPVVGVQRDDDLGSDSGSAYVVSSSCNGDLGSKCTSGLSCPSGFCVDGVCCDSACGGGANDCQACSVAAGAAKDGVCAPIKKGTVCRAAGGGCDLAETCNGASITCPGDILRASGTACRPKAGPCDVAEICNGSSKACPVNNFLTSGTACRVAAGGCDNPEFCSGKSAGCPADGLRLGGHVCRAAAGTCDVAEMCNGVSKACPTNIVAAAGKVCRAAADVCDMPETCTGSWGQCPVDSVKSAGAVCRASGGGCDLAESCTGSSKSCPTDAVRPYQFTCRAAAGVCDAAEQCDGSTKACPADKVLKVGAVCRAAAGLCDKVESCNGVGASCPKDVLMSQGATCRAAADVCDLKEQCSGITVICPKDVYVPNGTSCASGKGLCQGGKCVAKGDAGLPDFGKPDVGMPDVGTPDIGAGKDTGASKDIAADTATTDSVATPDLGPLPPTDEGGCDCRVGSSAGNVTGLWLLLALLAVWRRRRFLQ